MAAKKAKKTAKKIAMDKPTEGEAAVAIARAWLDKAGFHEDPAHESPERLEVQGSGWEGRSHEHYVDVRFYIPAIDIEHVVDGTHPDGITAEPS
jgi:hypothetical protein